MPRTAASFKAADLERAVRTLRKLDLPIARVEIAKDGKITVFHQDDAKTEPANPYDDWKAKRDARSTERT